MYLCCRVGSCYENVNFITSGLFRACQPLGSWAPQDKGAHKRHHQYAGVKKGPFLRQFGEVEGRRHPQNRLDRVPSQFEVAQR